MRVYQLIRVSGWRPTATSAHRTARRKRWDDLERIMRMVSSAIPIITFRYDPYKRKKLTFWVSLYFLSAIAVQYLLLVLSLFYSLEITVRIDFQFTYRKLVTDDCSGRMGLEA